jgi:hypothetical protein
LAGNRRTCLAAVVVGAVAAVPPPPQPAATMGLASARHAPVAIARPRAMHTFLAQVADE